ncbi:MAG: UDP-N-acetylmuramoyl-L-alanine--D-glutamate ligase [Halanaerobiaceae bacterium]
MIQLEGMLVGVIGLSKRTGVSTARRLVKEKARVVVSDIKGKEQLEEQLNELEGYDISYELGGHGEKCLSVDLLVVSPGVPLDLPFFRQVEAEGIPVISEIELAYQLTSAGIIAITGTNGKTTTTSLLGEILNRSEICPVKVAGNIGIPLIDEAPDLPPEGWVVAEVSSFQLEAIRDFRPDISIYLNFTPDHLDRHKTVEAYWKAKKNIFVNQLPEDKALINSDDLEVVRAAADCRAHVYSVSCRERPEQGVYQQGKNLVFREDGCEQFLLNVDDIPLAGKHNVENTAFAAGAAYLLGVKCEIIREAILGFNAVEHRLEKLGITGDDILVVDDSKGTNPAAAVKALEAFERPLILIAGGQDREADFSELARRIVKKVKVLILLGETRDIIATAVLNIGFNNIHKVGDMAEAVAVAARESEPGDCLLLSPGCPSWDMYDSYRERGRDFREEIGRHFTFR